MPNFKRTRNNSKKTKTTTAVPQPVTQKAISKTRRSTSVSVSEPEPEPEPETKPWEIGDKVKPQSMPDDTFYTIVGDAGDGVNWLMKVGRSIGGYCESIPKINETNGTWEYWTPDAAALKKRYKRKSKTKRMKSKRMKSKRRKTKRRKSKRL